MRPTAGRHVRRTALRAALISLPATALPPSLVVAGAAPLAAGAGILGATLVLSLAVCRLVAAHDADETEERWLRRALGELRPVAAENEDGDPDLYLA